METKLNKIWTLILRNLEGENYRHTVIGHSAASYLFNRQEVKFQKEKQEWLFWDIHSMV